MSWPLAYLYAGLVAASVAAASYGVWSARWARRGAILLSVLNGLIALVGVLLILVHLWGLTTPTLTELRIRRVPYYVLFTDLLFLLPAVTRLLELRRDKRRDATRSVIQETIIAARDGRDHRATDTKPHDTK